MNDNSFKPPVTNRGVVSTLENVKMCIDWVQVTIFDYAYSPRSLFKFLFNIDEYKVLSDCKGIYGYDVCFYFQDIKIYSSSTRDDMGFHLLISGSACRQVEDLGINFIELFKSLKKLNSHFTRLDIAIDNFTNDYFTMKRVQSCIKNNLVVSRFKNSIEFVKTDLDSNENKGYTIWLGSRASKIQFVFYDKLKERESQNVIIEKNIKFWTRLEIRFRDNYATEVALNLISGDINDYIKGLCKNYVKFICPGYNDSKRCRIPLINWWNDFIGDVDRIKLYNSNYQNSICRKKQWLIESTSHSNAMVLLSEIENLSLDELSCKYLVKYFNDGLIDITEKDLHLINEERIKKGFNPIFKEDFCYWIGDIKDFMLKRR